MAFVAVITLYYTGVAIYRIVNYRSLSEQTNTRHVDWRYEATSSETWAPVGRYTFEVDGHLVTGQTQLNSSLVHNPEALAKSLESLNAERWTVWYDPRHPQHSTLQKILPIKECLSAITLMILLLYFFGLGIYVGKRFDAKN